MQISEIVFTPDEINAFEGELDAAVRQCQLRCKPKHAARYEKALTVIRQLRGELKKQPK